MSMMARTVRGPVQATAPRPVPLMRPAAPKPRTRVVPNVSLSSIGSTFSALLTAPHKALAEVSHQRARASIAPPAVFIAL
jgi:hypothetical protein